MKFLSLAPFVPSGPDFESSKQFFIELGFPLCWDAGDYAGFGLEGSMFILQKFDSKPFAENFMVTVGIADAEGFWKEVMDKKLPQKFWNQAGKAFSSAIWQGS